MLMYTFSPWRHQTSYFLSQKFADATARQCTSTKRQSFSGIPAYRGPQCACKWWAWSCSIHWSSGVRRRNLVGRRNEEASWKERRLSKWQEILQLQTSTWPHGSPESSHLSRNQLRQVNQRNGIWTSCVTLVAIPRGAEDCQRLLVNDVWVLGFGWEYMLCFSESVPKIVRQR